jgi:hypothetical protein
MNDLQDQLHAQHACLRAQGAMICALARAHPQPEVLRRLFDEEARQTLLIAHGEGAASEWLDVLRQMLDQYRSHIPAGT